jgi:transcriptional regulator
MSLYTPRHFKSRDDAEALRIIREHPFATLITSIDAMEPLVTHLPLLLDGDALDGHMARPNPHWQHFARGRTVAVFHGPHAYISPRWYVEPEKNVPTWNYAVVHAHGRPQMLDDEATRRVVTGITSTFDPDWAPTEDKLARLLPGVVAFRIPIERLDAKVKMNQNRTAADRAKVIDTLRAGGGAEQLAVADWIRIDS